VQRVGALHPSRARVRAPRKLGCIAALEEVPPVAIAVARPASGLKDEHSLSLVVWLLRVRGHYGGEFGEDPGCTAAEGGQ
jgi:hypothetical protein